MFNSVNSSKITFTAQEKKLLVSLLKHEKVIEDLRTNKSTNKLKAEAWSRITKRYNNHAFVTRRETIQLRRCWEKIKRLTKDLRSKEMQIRTVTDGGSPLLELNIDSVPVVEEVLLEIPSTVDSNTDYKIASNYQTQNNWDIMQHGQISNSTSSDLISTRQTNVLKEREQQQELYWLRRSILNLEKEQVSENLRHIKEINKIKELNEAEKLEHDRALRIIELQRASV